MSEQELTRRNFLGLAGVAAAGAATLGLAGCAPKTDSAHAAGGGTPTSAPATWDEEYDVVVCGAGIAGLAAGICAAREGNGAKVLIVEKDVTPNGNSPFCAGSMLYCDDAEAFGVYLKAMLGDHTPDDVQKAFCEALTENLDWLYELGAKEEWLDIGAPATEPDPAKGAEWPELENWWTYGRIKFKTKDTDGPTHVHTFFEQTAENTENLTIEFSTPMESLVQDPETKTILGVVAGGKTYKANKGVIMCTGGFESDPDMLYNFTGVTGCVPYAGKANTGDGHRACAAVGAGFWHMYGGAQYWTALRNLDNTEFLSTVWNFTKKNLGITVGVSGRRFYMDYDACSCPTSPYAEPGSDIHLNMGYRHGITNFGGTWNHLPLPEVTWFIFDADAMATGEIFTDITDDPVADGWAYEAATIEELAGKIEVPAAELTATVAQWNEFCERGADMAFYRPADTLTPVKTGPFYAMRCVPAMLNTDGGPTRNAQGQILDPFGEPIPHLYSAGEFGSVWGHLYQGTGNVGECAAFGRIAARSALANE